MTPDPTPVEGMTPRSPLFALPVTVIRTTAGLTAAATAMVAEFSSMVTGLTAPTEVPVAVVVAPGSVRSRAPVAPSASTVPPDARTADSSATAMTGPPVRRDVVGATATAGAGSAAGSYQRSGVGVAGGASYVRIQSGRASGVGE